MKELKVENRTVLGKKTRTLRRTGMVPAEIYGRGFANRHVMVPVKAFAALYQTAGTHTVITLAVDGEKIPAVIADVVRDPLSDEILAVDFHAIRTDEKIRARVPLIFTGTAPAAKAGFVVVEVVHEVEIEALPHELIHKLEVPLDRLEKPGDSVSLKDLALPPSVKFSLPPDTVLVTVREHVKEAAPPPAATEAAPTGEAAATAPEETSRTSETAGGEKKPEKK